MYKNTRIHELLDGSFKQSFEEIVRNRQGNKFCKGFHCWNHLVAMVYAQISGCRSLREVETGFNSQRNTHYHLACQPIKRSTLADANSNRNVDVFADACSQLIQSVKGTVNHELKDLLYLLDSTPIPLKGLGYEWTEDCHNHRTHGLKVHMLYEANSTLPVHASITPANINDINVARQLPIETGATYVFDKGYYDYNWWFKLDQAGSCFVTRFKHNAGLKQINARPLTQRDKGYGILSDEIVEFKNRRPGGGRINQYYGAPLRRVTISRPDKTTDLVIATNDFQRSAEEIAELYKRRWSIELFFKWLKQNLKIKRFLGRSENAVRLQIFTAIITYLLAYLAHRRSNTHQSLTLWLVELREGLFLRKDTVYAIEKRRRRETQELARVQGVLHL